MHITPHTHVCLVHWRDAEDAIQDRDGYNYDGYTLRVERPRGASGRGGYVRGGGSGYAGHGGNVNDLHLYLISLRCDGDSLMYNFYTIPNRVEQTVWTSVHVSIRLSGYFTRNKGWTWKNQFFHRYAYRQNKFVYQFSTKSSVCLTFIFKVKNLKEIHCEVNTWISRKRWQIGQTLLYTWSHMWPLIDILPWARFSPFDALSRYTGTAHSTDGTC